MGNRGSSSGGSGGGSRGSVTVREGMTTQQINTVVNRIGEQAKQASEKRSSQFNQLSQQYSEGKMSLSEMSERIEAINKSYNDTMDKLRSANNKLTALYGISVTM